MIETSPLTARYALNEIASPESVGELRENEPLTELMFFFMSKDIIHTEWHLTPRGWVRGDWSANEPLESNVPPPADRIETWVTTETTYDMQFAKAQREWTRTWASSQHSEVERTAMRASIRVLAPESETAKPFARTFR